METTFDSGFIAMEVISKNEALTNQRRWNSFPAFLSWSSGSH
jgi:hypothetical protein